MARNELGAFTVELEGWALGVKFARVPNMDELIGWVLVATLATVPTTVELIGWVLVATFARVPTILTGEFVVVGA
jgi:hypothetical protein